VTSNPIKKTTKPVEPDDDSDSFALFHDIANLLLPEESEDDIAIEVPKSDIPVEPIVEAIEPMPIIEPVPEETPAAVQQSGKSKRVEADDPNRFKRMKLQGSDQELIVDVKRLVKYSDVDKQANTSSTSDLRSTIDYGDL